MPTPPYAGELLPRLHYGEDAAGLAGSLAASTAVGAESITVEIPPHAMGASTYFVVIDAFTDECEIRRVTAESGNRTQLTVSALTYAHDAGDSILITTNPEAPIEWFGASVAAANNLTAVTNAMVQCSLAQFIARVGVGFYTINFGSVDEVDNWIKLTARVTLQGAGQFISGFQYGPDDAPQKIYGFRIQGVGFECYDLSIRPPNNSDIATTDMDSLEEWSAFWFNCSDDNGDPGNLYVRMRRVTVEQGFEVGARFTGDGSNGYEVDIDGSCDIDGYLVGVTGSNLDDVVANKARRIFRFGHSKSAGHNGEGDSTWDDRGRTIYIHPQVSLDINQAELEGSGQGRPIIGHYSSGGVKWNAWGPEWANIRYSRLIEKEGGPVTEGFQTTSLLGVTTQFSYGVIDVSDLCARIRGNTHMSYTEVRGATKHIGPDKAGPIKTYVAVAGALDDTTIELADASIFSDTDPIDLHMDDNTLHSTTVSGAPVGNVVTLAAALPGPISINRWVVHTDFDENTTEWIRYSNNHFSNDPTPDSMVLADDRVTQYSRGDIVELNSQDSNSGHYHDNPTGDGSTFYAFGTDYRSVGKNKGVVCELENAGAKAYYDGCTFEGEWSGPAMIVLTADTLSLTNFVSNADSTTGEFCSGAAPAGTVVGHDVKFMGTAKPRMDNPQLIAPGKGMCPTVIVATGGELVLDPNYDTFLVNTTTTITGISFGDAANGNKDAAINRCYAGKVSLVTQAAFTINDTATVKVGGAPLALAANVEYGLTFDSLNGLVIGERA